MREKLISADKMIAILETIQDVVKAVTVENVIYNLKIAPAVDAVEVVRCRECRHYHQYYAGNFREATGWGKCTLINMDIDMTVGDYCSHGERRDEDAVY